MIGWLKFALLWLALVAGASLIGNAIGNTVASFLTGIMAGCASVLVAVERGWILS